MRVAYACVPLQPVVNHGPEIQYPPFPATRAVGHDALHCFVGMLARSSAGRAADESAAYKNICRYLPN